MFDEETGVGYFNTAINTLKNTAKFVCSRNLPVFICFWVCDEFVVFHGAAGVRVKDGIENEFGGE